MNIEPINPLYEEGDPWAEFAETLFDILEGPREEENEEEE